jgi:hypothetical protein
MDCAGESVRDTEDESRQGGAIRSRQRMIPRLENRQTWGTPGGGNARKNQVLRSADVGHPPITKTTW